MPAPPSPAETTEQALPASVMPEAMALAFLLSEMGVTLGVSLDQERLFAEVDDTTSPGALDVLKIVHMRSRQESKFRDDMIGAIGSIGYYLASAPGIDLALKTAPAADLIQALAKAGLLIRHHYERGDGRSPMLSFMPIPGNPVAPNSHMLMKLAVERFADEPEFAAAVTKFVIETGQSQHDA